MDITYNNIVSPSNILTFTDVPNILKVEEYVSGSEAMFTFTFQGNLQSQVTGDSQFYITFLGETVDNTMSPSAAKNKRFYIASDNAATAASLTRAFRNCASLSAEFNIIHSGASVRLVAKTIGQKWSQMSNYLQRNISNDYLITNGVDGNAYSDLFGGRITVDVYSGTSTSDNYITTLEKNFYGNECAFNVSPVLVTFSEYGKTKPYLFDVSLIKANGGWEHLGSSSGNTAIGFHCNQSDKYKYAMGVQVLTNKNRQMTLYTYTNTVDYSVLIGSDSAGANVTLKLLDSANNLIWSTNTTIRKSSSNYIVDAMSTFNEQAFSAAYKAVVEIGQDKIEYNIIKPLRATEYYQRVLWRNEYGGISFFDFTGAKSESDSTDIETYEKNVFDYYTNDEFERKKIYSNEYDKQVTLTSHLLEEKGKYIFNSLMMSKKIWTVVNDKVYYIIPKSIEVSEDNNYNGIFTAKLTYTYSDI